MLTSLRIADFAIIDRLELELGSGLVVFTGETGAGKSIIIDAVALLLGGKAESALVRAGAEVARVEGTFTLDSLSARRGAGWGAGLRDLLAREQLLGDGDDELTIAREVRREGRSTCRVNGTLVSLALVRELGEHLVDVHGQSEHLSLLRPREHLFLLDRFAELDAEREAFAAVVRELNGLRRELETLRTSERERERRLETLRFQVHEIAEAQLQPDEEPALYEERTRLANTEKLTGLVEAALTTLDPELEEAPSALQLLAQCARAVSDLAAIDPVLAEPAARAQSLQEQLAELVGELRNYRERLEFNPARLELLDDRLHLLRGLQRKYGASVAEVIAFGERAQQELDTLAHSGERIAELQQREEQLLRSLGELGTKLTTARVAAGKKLAKGIEQELAELRMEGAKFAVEVAQSEDENGAHSADRRLAFDASGLDRVEFLVAPNVGEGLKPLVKIASGGETARLMLALKGVLARADRTPTLIFDEIDQGIGGRVGATVGAKLWRLATSHQVLCITHLPQLAAYGDQHFKVEKSVDGADARRPTRTTTRLKALADSARVAELAQMLGVAGEKSKQSAEELLRQVNAEKNSKRSALTPSLSPSVSARVEGQRERAKRHEGG